MPEPGRQTADWIFRPVESDKYGTVQGQAEIVVNKATPVIRTAPAAEAIVYHPGKKLSDVPLTGGQASVAGTFAWQSPDLTPEAPGGSYTVVFTPEDQTRYTAATAQVNLAVGKATPAAEATAASIVYGQPVSDSELTGQGYYSNTDKNTKVAGAFTWQEPELCPGAGINTLDVRFTPTDQKNYNSVTLQVDLEVAKAQKPALCPPPEINVPYSVETLCDDILKDYPGWCFSEEDLGTPLEAEKGAFFVVMYTGRDASCYEEVSMGVDVIRSAEEVEPEDPEVPEVPEVPVVENIVPKGTKLTKLTKGKKSFTAVWKKQKGKTKGLSISGYQLQYSTSSNFKKNSKKVNVAGVKVTSKKVKKLKAKKKYFVRIRTYIKKGNNSYYSSWSPKKTVKVK